MKALAIIFDGFEELEAIAPFDLLRRAQIELTIASAKKEATGSHQLTLNNLALLNEINYKDYDCLLLPGGPHHQLLRVNEKVLEIIHFYMKHKEKIVCAICAAPTIIGSLGYLKGKRYTCFTAMNEEFGGIFEDKDVIVDGNLITARSAANAIDFGYEIVKKLVGEDNLKHLWAQLYYEK